MKSFPDMEWGTAPADSFTMSLDSMKSLLARLGNPQDGRRTVHITGSKGKGSTSTFIASILRHAGQKTALYISPHLSDYRERIQIDSRLISEEEFAEEIERMRDAVEAEHGSGNGPIVNFGISTALFFQFAARQNVDWQVVEVGLGGRDDATNVMADKDLAVSRRSASSTLPFSEAHRRRSLLTKPVSSCQAPWQCSRRKTIRR